MSQKGFANIFFLSAIVLITLGIFLYLLRIQSSYHAPLINQYMFMNQPSPQSSIANNSNTNSFPQFIQQANIVYKDKNSNIYLLKGLFGKPIFIDRGASPSLSSDRTKIAYSSTDSKSNYVMIYDVTSGKKTVFIVEPEVYKVEDISWSPKENYILVKASIGNSVIAQRTIYTYPSANKITILKSLTYNAESIHWLNDNEFIYSQYIDSIDKLNFHERCVGDPLMAMQISKLTLPSSQNQILIPATANFDFNLMDVYENNLYYAQSNWTDLTCTPPVDRSTIDWKSNIDGTGQVKIDYQDIPYNKINALFAQFGKLKESYASVDTIKYNPTNSNWVLFSTVDAGCLSCLYVNPQTMPPTIFLMNLQDPGHTFKKLVEGSSPNW